VFELLSDPPEAMKTGDDRNLAGSSGMAYAFWPPFKRERTGAASFDLTGQWELEMKFAASKVKQTLVFEQQENEIIGTHTASMAPRDLSGTLHGNDIQFRSSYTGQGMRINYTFTGIVDGETMEGKVSLGEYGMADWKAKRREYQIPGR
jgi:L-seryl-tRNA(Ser) seleniumtransferase